MPPSVLPCMRERARGLINHTWNVILTLVDGDFSFVLYSRICHANIPLTWWGYQSSDSPTHHVSIEFGCFQFPMLCKMESVSAYRCFGFIWKWLHKAKVFPPQIIYLWRYQGYTVTSISILCSSLPRCQDRLNIRHHQYSQNLLKSRIIQYSIDIKIDLYYPRCKACQGFSAVQLDSHSWQPILR